MKTPPRPCAGRIVVPNTKLSSRGYQRLRPTKRLSRPRPAAAPGQVGEFVTSIRPAICVAATACQGFCRAELDTFRTVLGPAASSRVLLQRAKKPHLVQPQLSSKKDPVDPRLDSSAYCRPVAIDAYAPIVRDDQPVLAPM